MEGLQLDYKLKKGMSSRFNQKMFGRISTRRVEDKVYAYYIPGVLDNVPHFRIFEGRVFLATTQDVDFDPVLKYVDQFNISTVEKEEGDIFFKTSKERWRFHAREKGVNVEGL